MTATADLHNASDMRGRLLTAAVELLATDGPAAMTTRRVAAAAGMSSMVVYTHFGSIGALLEAVVADGFKRLGALEAELASTDDPVADLMRVVLANVDFARAHANLYQVVFGSVPLGNYRSGQLQQAEQGRSGTLGLAVLACARAIGDGRFLPGEPFLLAHQLWVALHGCITLEIAGHIVPPNSTRKVLIPTMISLFTGLGDDRDRAQASVLSAVTEWKGA